MDEGRKGGLYIIWLDKYRIVSMLGTTASSEVFLAEHVKLQAKRVLKRVRKNHPFYMQLAGEVGILRNLDHPGIPRLYDVEEDERYLYLIEEFVEGISLRDLVASGRLKEQQIILIILQICNITQYLHQQNPPVFYLDWKPEHLIVSEGNVKLIDYGAAIQADGVDRDLRQSLCLGTKGYAPPEVKGGGEVGAYTDVYGIGSILDFLIAGKGSYTRRLRRVAKACLFPDVKKRWSLEQLTGTMERQGRGRRKGEISPCGKRVIGLIGTHPGAGVTHISFLLAFYLAEVTGKSVAYVECNRHGDCGRFQKRQIAEKQKRGLGKRPVFYPDVSPEELPELLNREHAYYVVDFGCELERNWAEYLHCSDKIVIAQLREWRQEDLDQFERKSKTCTGRENWHFWFNLCSNAHRRGISFPYEEDLRHPSERAAKIFEHLLMQKER